MQHTFHRFCFLAAALGLFVGVSAHAGWFLEDGSYQTRREEKVAVLSPARLDELRALIVARDARWSEVSVLDRLATEKAEAVEALNARFAGEYGIRPDRNYTFDPADQTIYLLSDDERHGGSAEAPVRLPHRVFPTAEEAQEFLSLMQAKDAALAAQRLFLETRLEKAAALTEVTARMGREFSLDPARSYRLDPVVRSIYAQYVPPRAKTPEEIAAEKDAKAAAERRAREEAIERRRELRAEAKRIADERASLSEEQKESIKVREEALRKVERELADLDAKSNAEAKATSNAEAKAARERERAAKAAAEAKVRAEKKAAKEKAEAERVAAEEKARAEKKAAKEKAEAERVAKVAAEEKARAEKKAAKEKAEAERVAAEEKARAEKKAAEEKAEAERAAAVANEKAEIERRVAALTQERTARRDLAAQEFATAQQTENTLDSAIRAAKKRLRSTPSDKKLDTWRHVEEERIETIQKQLSVAHAKVRESRAALSAAESALSRSEKDAIQAFENELKAKGQKPLTISHGFLGLF